MKFIMSNIGTILVIVAVLYFIVFFVSYAKAKKGEMDGFTYRPKNFIAFLLILGIGVYCLVTGQDINQFIN